MRILVKKRIEENHKYIPIPRNHFGTLDWWLDVTEIDGMKSKLRPKLVDNLGFITCCMKPFELVGFHAFKAISSRHHVKYSIQRTLFRLLTGR